MFIEMHYQIIIDDNDTASTSFQYMTLSLRTE